MSSPVDPEAYGMDCRPGPSRYPAANRAAIIPESVKAGVAARAAELAAAAPIERVVVGGVPVDRLTGAQLCDRLVADFGARKGGRGGAPKVGTTVNGQVMSLFASNPAFREALLAADYIAADGMSVVNGSRMFTRRALPERVPTTDWFHDAADTAARHGIRFFMLGATASANAAAVKRASERHPGLQIVGARDGYFKDDEVEAVAAQVAASGADVLWVGVGNPRQIMLAHRFKSLLPQLTWVRTCGGLFDHLSGEVARAPSALQAMNLEWAWRVALEPRRLLWRYLTTNVHSSWLMATRSER